MTLPQIKPNLPVEQELNLRGAEGLTLCSLLLGSNWTPNAFYFLRKILRNWLDSYSLQPATCQEGVSVRHCAFSSSMHWTIEYFFKLSLPIFTLAENLQNRNSKSMGTSLIPIIQWEKCEVFCPHHPHLISYCYVLNWNKNQTECQNRALPGCLLSHALDGMLGKKLRNKTGMLSSFVDFPSKKGEKP